MSTRTISTVAAALLAGLSVAPGALAQHDHDQAETFKPSIWGVELPVGDVEAAMEFYVQTMGFTPVGASSTAGGPVLDNHGLKVTFRATDAPLPPPGPRLNINLSVPDLPVAIEAARKAGATVLNETPQSSAIGVHVPILDPDGNEIHLIDLTSDETEPGDPPKLYNVGFTVTDMEAAESFYTTLGFEIYSRKYLPDTLPLIPVGAAMIVLHPHEGPALGADVRISTLLLDTELDLDHVRADLATRDLKPVKAWDGLELRTPTGHRVRVISPPASAEAISMDANTAAEYYDRFKAMEGVWMAKSTRGWEDRQIFRVIANGSAVMQISEFKDAPEQTMATMYHLDGDKLMLTHYCAARNQPRLQATTHDGLGGITFEFMDVTGIPSRDVGHMDMAAFRFVEGGGFSERWTWYANGQGKWMEDVVYRRVE